MKKVYVVMALVALLGVSGNRLLAQEEHLILPKLSAEQEKSLPPEVKEFFDQIKSGRTKGQLPPEIQKYDNSLESQRKELYKQLEFYVNKYPYDFLVNFLVQTADGILDQVINNRKSIDAKAQENSSLIKFVQSIVYYLKGYTPPPPTTFPGKCKIYRENKAQGNIEYLNRTWKITVCFDHDCPTFLFAKDAGSTDGESINDRPPARGFGTVYFNIMPTPNNAKTAKVQCYHPNLE